MANASSPSSASDTNPSFSDKCPPSSPDWSPREANIENAAKDSGGDKNVATETRLREILRELGLNPKCIKEAINLFSMSALNEVESIMKAHFDLLVEIRDNKLKHADVKKNRSEKGVWRFD